MFTRNNLTSVLHLNHLGIPFEAYKSQKLFVERDSVPYLHPWKDLTNSMPWNCIYWVKWLCLSFIRNFIKTSTRSHLCEVMMCVYFWFLTR